MPESRTNFSSVADLLIDLDPGRGALHRQVATSIRAQIRAGRLSERTCLPPTRSLQAEKPAQPHPADTCYPGATANAFHPAEGQTLAATAGRRQFAAI
jgi:hypothetical protein